MLKNILLLLVVVFVLSVSSQSPPRSCDTISDCSSNQYCVGSFCVGCKTNNDCELDEYCAQDTSKNFTGFMQCVKFDIYGDNCLNLNTNELTNSTTSNSTKCATTFWNDNTQSLEVDFEGFCSSGKCRMCDYTNYQVLDTPGKGPQRVCVFPGKYSTVHSASWAPGRYFEEPIQVWLAIFFCLLVLILSIHIVSFLLKR